MSDRSKSSLSSRSRQVAKLKKLREKVIKKKLAEERHAALESAARILRNPPRA